MLCRVVELSENSMNAIIRSISKVLDDFNTQWACSPDKSNSKSKNISRWSTKFLLRRTQQGKRRNRRKRSFPCPTLSSRRCYQLQQQRKRRTRSRERASHSMKITASMPRVIPISKAIQLSKSKISKRYSKWCHNNSSMWPRSKKKQASWRKTI